MIDSYREDPKGYLLTLTDDGQWSVKCLVDNREVGVYPERDEAVDAAIADDEVASPPPLD